jgi:probable F420-dependent oxidoreductase
LAKAFRFGVQVGTIPPRKGHEPHKPSPPAQVDQQGTHEANLQQPWIRYVQKVESLGYSSLFFPDHFGKQLEPLSAIAATAAVTSKLRVGTLVLGVDYRHPVVVAKAAATIQALSGGRLELGVGAGWMRSDYDQAGLPMDAPGTRVERLREAVEILRRMWTQPSVTFEGAHYNISDIAGEKGLLEDFGVAEPSLLIGGGGRRVLAIAAKYANIVGINPTLAEGRVTAKTAADLSPSRAQQKVAWVREAAEKAGRDPESLELQVLVFAVAIGRGADQVRQAIAGATGMEPGEVAECPLFLTGSPEEIKDKLISQRQELGISYIVIQDMQMTLPGTLERFADEVMADLAKGP